MKVLVVDDSRAMRMIVSRELRNASAVDDVSEADSAEAAIEVLGSEPVDLVLCDWNMGGMTGLELLEALRAAGWTVPFGFVTSESSDSVVAAAKDAGAAFLLAKPFTGEDLVAKVDATLGGGQAGDTGTAAGELDPPTALRQLLEGLLRRHITVDTVSGGPERQAARWTADYADDAGEKAALCVVETPLAAAMSAALTMLSPAMAAQWADSNTMPLELADNFHEVTNVLSKIVHAGGKRCVLRDIAGFAPGEQLPEIEQVRAAAQADHFRVSVEGYGGGLLSLVTL